MMGTTLCRPTGRVSTLSAKHGGRKRHLEDLQKACVLRWRGCEGTTKERRVLQASSGEDAGIRALLLSRVGARRAEGGHRFARVYSCRSAAHLSAPANTDLREARVLCWLYKGRWLLRGSDNLHGRSNGVGDWAGRAANLYIFAYRAGARRAVSQGYASRGNGGSGSHDDVLCCCRYMPGSDGVRLHCTAPLVIAGGMHCVSGTRAKARSRETPSKRQENSTRSKGEPSRT